MTCAAILTGLLSAWVATGGAGTITRVQLKITMAAVSIRAFTASGASAGSATTYLTITNLSSSPDELVSARRPACSHVVLTRHASTAGSGPVIAGLPIPAHRSTALSPFGNDVILIDPVPLQVGQLVLLTLTFRQAGPITVEATVTPPGTP